MWWAILCFRKSDDWLDRTIRLPTIDDDAVRQILHHPNEPHIRFYAIDVPGKKEFEELAAYSEDDVQFDESLIYFCEYDVPYGADDDS